jgi:hypothetical protein
MYFSKSNLLDENQTAKMLRISRHKLRNDRVKHRGLPYIKVGRRVLYWLNDIETYLEKHRIVPAGE